MYQTNLKVKIILTPTNHVYDKSLQSVFMSERDVPFASSYQVRGKNRTTSFEFSHSTGPEFDPGTKWIYTCAELPGLKLVVMNDAAMTERAGAAYLKHKLQK